MSYALDTVSNPPSDFKQYLVCDRNGAVGPQGECYNWNLTSHQLAGPITASSGSSFPITNANLVNTPTLTAYCNVVLIYASAVNVPLGAPLSGRDDGKILRFISATPHAHTVVLQGGIEYNGSSGTHATATFSTNIEDSLVLLAWQGNWYVISSNGITFST
jgi:hypothetical protein